MNRSDCDMTRASDGQRGSNRSERLFAVSRKFRPIPDQVAFEKGNERFRDRYLASHIGTR